MGSAPSPEVRALEILEISHDLDLEGQARPAAGGTNEFLRKWGFKVVIHSGRGVRQENGLHQLHE